MSRLASLLLATCLVLNLTGCNKMTPTDPLPRHQAIKAFDPHRKDFICKYEADAVPPVDAQAEALNQEALYVTRFTLDEEKMDWKTAERLWAQAAAQKHWKAMMNLASLYEQGQGQGTFEIKRNIEKSVEIVENAMRLGIPAAYDKMGNYHAEGRGGIHQDSSRAWAFWQLAAEMGNPQALTHIGKALAATYDGEGFWGNMPIAIKMLDCAVTQGFGQAAYELGIVLNGSDTSIGENYARALKVLHDGVKLGSEKAANSLFVNFDDGKPLVSNLKDPIRADRYKALADALYHNPDLKFPNLDKVLPLPPAKLPAWDGQSESLVKAAQGVTPVAPPQPTPGAKLPGRAHTTDGWLLPTHPRPLADEAAGGGRAMPQYEHTAAQYTGYWLPYLIEVTEPRQAAWNAAQVPHQYKRGESFAVHRAGLASHDGRIMWAFMGLPEKAPARVAHALVRAGILREVALTGTALRCTAGKTCPHTGIWAPAVVPEHPHGDLIKQWWRQAFVEEGQPMPDETDWGLPVTPGGVVWRLHQAGDWSQEVAS